MERAWLDRRGTWDGSNKRLSLPVFAGRAPRAAGGSDQDDMLWADVFAAARMGGRINYRVDLVSHLLRLIRNTSDERGGGHYDELPALLRAQLEAMPGGLARLVLRRFPTLVLATWRTGRELGWGGGGGGGGGL